MKMLLLALLITMTGGAVTRITVSSGNWGNASTWSPSGSPACGDSVIISVGMTVSVTNQQNYNNCPAPIKIVIWGHLKFFNGSKLSLPCGSYVMVKSGGLVDADVGLANSNLIEICNVVEWNSNSILNGPACIPLCSQVCGGCYLPVELSGFRAEACSFKKVCLSWETASEKNSDYFVVERSADALNFSELIQINSQSLNNAGSGFNYAWIDDEPLDGMNYYRLKMVDRDGRTKRSAIVSLQARREGAASVLIYPNCNNGEFTVMAGGFEPDQRLLLQLRNISGKVVFEKEYNIDGDNTAIRIVPHLKIESGLYFCSVKIGNTFSHSRMIVRD